MSTRPLFTVVVLILIAATFSTIFAILNKLPYEFGGTGNPETVAVDSISHGTAISPPLTARGDICSINRTLTETKLAWGRRLGW